MLSGIPPRTLWPSFRAKGSPLTPDTNTDVQGLGREDASCETDDDMVRELNEALVTLSTIFPDVRSEVFREMLTTFSPESRLHVATEAMLRDKTKYVRGRWRLPPKDENQKPAQNSQGSADWTDEIVAVHDRFRSARYKSTVKEVLYSEFKSLSHSTIRAVLAERNHSYADSRLILVELNNKSWKASLANMVFRRKVPKVDEHPLVTWSYREDGISLPYIRPTSSPELDRELEDLLIVPARIQRVGKQLEEDQSLAEQINETEAERENATYDCQCCFTSSTFEAISTCNEGHYVCTRCVRLSLNEALFGQSWARSIDPSRSTLKCVAISENGKAACEGFIARDSVQRATNSDKAGQETWVLFDEKLARQNLDSSGLVLARCPFCPYAEIDELHVPGHKRESEWWLPLYLLVVVCLTLELRLPKFTTTLLTLAAFLVHASHLRQRAYLQITAAVASKINNTPLSHGRKFQCQSPRCQRISCLRCAAAWHDIHVCHSSSRQSLRTFIESAVTDAVKRTCPSCGLSFVKASGCNKLVCTCGYAMCYVCRADIRREKYAHFCPHFRPDGGTCPECDRCDLYKTEDEELVVKRARAQAEKEWWEREGGGLENAGIEDVAMDEPGHLTTKQRAWKWLAV